MVSIWLPIYNRELSSTDHRIICKGRMFIKYVLLQDLSPDAKIQSIVLHPNRSVMAAGVYDSSFEVFFVEFRYRKAGKKQKGAFGSILLIQKRKILR